MDYELLICLLAIMIVMAILVPSGYARCIYGYAGNGAFERAFLCFALVMSVAQFVLNFFLAASWDGVPWSERTALDYSNSSVFVANMVMASMLSGFAVCGLCCMWLGVIKSSKDKDEEILADLERRVEFRDEKAALVAYTDNTDEDMVAKFE
jgi:hypothetical protein